MSTRAADFILVWLLENGKNSTYCYAKICVLRSALVFGPSLIVLVWRIVENHCWSDSRNARRIKFETFQNSQPVCSSRRLTSKLASENSRFVHGGWGSPPHISSILSLGNPEVWSLSDAHCTWQVSFYFLGQKLLEIKVMHILIFIMCLSRVRRQKLTANLARRSFKATPIVSHTPPQDRTHAHKGVLGSQPPSSLCTSRVWAIIANLWDNKLLEKVS